MKRFFFSAALVVLASSPLTGQKPDTAKAQLAEVRSLRCQFSLSTMTKWVSGKPVAGTVSRTETETVTYDAIDAIKGKARSIANVGATDITVFMAQTGLTFLGSDLVALDVTTVFPSLVGPQTFAAVNSRHFKLGEAIAGEQFYGSCRVLQ